MQQKDKGVYNPRIELSIFLGGGEDMERQGLFHEVFSSYSERGLGDRTQFELSQHLYRVHQGRQESQIDRAKPLTDVELLAQGCAGPLDMFVAWGMRQRVFVVVSGPPAMKKFK